jgi:ribonuclease BN (tRNA processing enzyme)
MQQGRITFLGTGTAFNQDGRGSQSLLVEPEDGSAFLVDAGPTTMAAITRERIDCSTIDRLFVTHLHGDHLAGWPFLLLHLVILHERRVAFDVYGPPGTQDCLEDLARLCYGDVLDRRQFEIRFHELEVARSSGLDAGPGLRLDTWPMRHHPSSIGLRFRSDGRAPRELLAVSGDTGWCEELERMAAGTSLLVLECTSVNPSVDVHICLDEVRERIGRLDAQRVVLTHLTDDVAESLAIDPVARVITAYDGMVLGLDDGV